MKASELISILGEMIQSDGDLEVIIRNGEMHDPEFISGVRLINANINEYEGFSHRYLSIPWNDTDITNTKVFEISNDV